MSTIAEPTIICPKCKAEIPLTESLAAPLLEPVLPLSDVL